MVSIIDKAKKAASNIAGAVSGAASAVGGFVKKVGQTIVPGGDPGFFSPATKKSGSVPTAGTDAQVEAQRSSSSSSSRDRESPLEALKRENKGKPDKSTGEVLVPNRQPDQPEPDRFSKEAIKIQLDKASEAAAFIYDIIKGDRPISDILDRIDQSEAAALRGLALGTVAAAGSVIAGAVGTGTAAQTVTGINVFTGEVVQTTLAGGVAPIGSVGARIATNPATVKLSGAFLSKAGMKTAAGIVTFLGAFGTYPWAAHTARESLESLTFPMTQALDAGDLDGYEKLRIAYEDATNPSTLEAIFKKVPYVNVILESLTGIKNSKAAVEQMDRLAQEQAKDLLGEGELESPFELSARLKEEANREEDRIFDERQAEAAEESAAEFDRQNEIIAEGRRESAAEFDRQNAIIEAGRGNAPVIQLENTPANRALIENKIANQIDLTQAELNLANQLGIDVPAQLRPFTPSEERSGLGFGLF